jgi:hypothetical protein
MTIALYKSRHLNREFSIQQERDSVLDILLEGFEKRQPTNKSRLSIGMSEEPVAIQGLRVVNEAGSGREIES